MRSAWNSCRKAKKFCNACSALSFRVVVCVHVRVCTRVRTGYSSNTIQMPSEVRDWNQPLVLGQDRAADSRYNAETVFLFLGLYTKSGLQGACLARSRRYWVSDVHCAVYSERSLDSKEDQRHVKKWYFRAWGIICWGSDQEIFGSWVVAILGIMCKIHFFCNRDTTQHSPPWTVPLSLREKLVRGESREKWKLLYNSVGIAADVKERIHYGAMPK